MHYIEINDVSYVREMFGQLLNKVQTIKSTGDYESAKELIMTYGTIVNKNIHTEVLNRIDKLNMPKVVGFITPLLIEKNKTIEIEQATDFLKQQIELHKDYVGLIEKNNIKIVSRKF